jgi:hypothetical protein
VLKRIAAVAALALAALACVCAGPVSAEPTFPAGNASLIAPEQPQIGGGSSNVVQEASPIKHLVAQCGIDSCVGIKLFMHEASTKGGLVFTGRPALGLLFVSYPEQAARLRSY